jgi:hypothetical protein
VDGQLYAGDLPDGLSEIFLQMGVDSPNQIEAPQQISVLAQAIYKASARSGLG